MKLADLSKPQWDAAQHAARRLVQTDPSSATARASFKGAVARLCLLLPEDVDAREIIMEAARWQMHNDVAAALAGLPFEAAA